MTTEKPQKEKRKKWRFKEGDIIHREDVPELLCMVILRFEDRYVIKEMFAHENKGTVYEDDERWEKAEISI